MITKFTSFLNQGQQRTILAKKNILFLFFIKISNILISFAMVSVSIKYLGIENYGLWIVLSGFIAWTNMFDFGFTHGLKNRLAELKAKRSLKSGRFLVSTTYAFLIIISIIFILLLSSLIYYINWVEILNITTLDETDVKYILMVILGLVGLQFILKPINAILEAYQWSSIVHFLMFLSSFFSLVIVFLLTLSDVNTSLSSYAFIVSGLSILVLFSASIFFYKIKFKSIRPCIRCIQKKYLNGIASLGIYFFILQFCNIVISQTDNIIISYLYDPSEVTKYNIAYKYFSIIIVLFNVIVTPFWIAFTDAYTKGDFQWIKKTISILLWFVAASAIGSLILFTFSDNVYKIWIGQKIVIPILLSALMAVYVVIFNIIAIFSFFISGVGKLKVILITSVIAAILNIPLSIFFAKDLGLGVAGIILATIFSISFSGIFSIIQYKKIISKKALGRWNA